MFQNSLRECPFPSSLQNEMMIIERLLCQALYGNISFNYFTNPYRLVLLNTCSTDGQTQEEEVYYPRSLRKNQHVKLRVYGLKPTLCPAGLSNPLRKPMHWSYRYQLQPLRP